MGRESQQMSLSFCVKNFFWRLTLIAVRCATAIQTTGAIKVVSRIARSLVLAAIRAQHQTTIGLIGGAGVALDRAA